MKFQTKLNLSFLTLALAIILTGYIGLISLQKVSDYNKLADKINLLVYLQNKMIAINSEAIATTTLKQLENKQKKFDKITSQFNETLSKLEKASPETSFEKLLTTEQKLQEVSDEIFTSHKKKLIQETSFKTSYIDEREQRRRLRNIIFDLEIQELTVKMGAVQYLSKETLYQHRDKIHYEEWLKSISFLKENVLKSIDSKVTDFKKRKIISILGNYEKTAKTMGKIVIDSLEIEKQHSKQIGLLQKIIIESENESEILNKSIENQTKTVEKNIFLTQILLLFFITMCTFSFSAYISTSISRVISNLYKGVQEIRKGQFSKIEINSKDEFGDLAKAFNSMSKELKVTKTSLLEANKTLEDKVNARTLDLQKAVIKTKETNRKLKLLSSKLSKYLSPQIYQSIFLGHKDVKLESYRKELTIFFSDIQGFTKITDNMESESLASLLNNYLDEMAKIALKYGGTIDKFTGDRVMAFFGDPQSKGKKKDAVNCVLMALEMREKMQELREEWNNQGITHPLHIRMGINTGYCTVGNFGSESRLDYTIIGGQVNLTSRLEANAKAGQILISHETYSLIKNKILCEKKELINVKGIQEPIQTYQVIDLRKNINKKTKKLNKKSTGFKLHVDFEKSNKEEVIDTLKEVLKKIDD